MDLSALTEFISPIILFACLIVGFLIKYTIPSDKVNRFIPLIVAVIGIVANIWVVGVIDLYTIVAGAISGLASTGLYEAFAQFIDRGGKVEKIIEIAEDAPEYENAEG